MYNYGLIGNRESRGESPDFGLPTSDLTITPYIPYVTNFSPTSDFRLLTSDFWLSTSNFQLRTSVFSPLSASQLKIGSFPPARVFCSSAGIDFLGNRANHDGWLDTSCYRNILNIRRIVSIPNTTMCSLTVTTPLIERLRSAIEFPWSCAPPTWQ